MKSYQTIEAKMFHLEILSKEILGKGDSDFQRKNWREKRRFSYCPIRATMCAI